VLPERTPKKKSSMPYDKWEPKHWQLSLKAFEGVDLAATELKVFEKLLIDSKEPASWAAKALKHMQTLGAEMVAKEEAGMDESDALFLSRLEDEILVWYPRTADHDQGYQDNTIDHGALRYFNTEELLARFFISAHTYHGAVANWRNHCIGITNMYTDGSGAYMPLFDYDGKNVKTRIRKDTKLLQETCGLGNAWVYETRRGFHVYFFSDRVSRNEYLEMLKSTEACKGFKKATANRNYAVLRVSAKYTEFDIRFLYMLPARDGKLRRMTRKAHLIQSLLALGEECGTHFASLYPQWARFQEDKKEWKPTPKRKNGKRIRKVKMVYDKAVDVGFSPIPAEPGLTTVKTMKMGSGETYTYQGTTSGATPSFDNKGFYVTTTSITTTSDTGCDNY